MLKFSFEVSHVIHANEHTWCAICDLYVNLKFCLMSFCFMIRKIHFKEKLSFWPQVPFKYKTFTREYVTLVLRRAYVAVTYVPVPFDYGWKTKVEIYILIMIIELPLLWEFIELSVCGCKTLTP